MENGVQTVDKTLTEEETKTADGTVSELKLVDNVVQVFHEADGSEGNDVETKVEDGEVLKLEESKDDVVKDVEGLKDEEGGGGAVETRTGDGAVSQLKLVDNVVQVFHESKNSEGDDVFEEAIADVNAKPDVEGTVVNGGENVEKVGGDDVVVEVNGRSNDVNEVDKFEEAVESYVASEDQSTEVEKAVIDDDEKLALVGESEKPVDEARGLDIVVDDGDANVDDTKSFDSLEVNASSNELDKFEELNEINISSADRNEQVEQVIVAEDAMEELAAAVDEVKEGRSEQADQSIVMEDVIEALADAHLVDEVKVVDGIVDDDKLKNVVSEEASNGVVGEEGAGVDSTVVMDGENGSLSNGEGEASVPRDAVVDDKSENGVLDVEQKPHVLETSSVVDQVIPGEIELSEGNESREQASGRDDQGLETSGTMESVNTSCSKVVDSPELRSVSRTLDAPVALETEVKEIISPSSVENNGITVNKKSEANAPETEVSNGPSTESIAENSDNRVPVEEPEVEVKNVQEKKDSLSTGKSGDSKSARAPEIQPAVEPAQPPPARPAGLGSAAPLLDPAPRAVQQQSRVNGAASQRQTQIVEDSTNGDTEENDETREKLQMIRVKFLRLAHRLGQTPHNVVVAQVLYRLGLAEQLRGRNTSRAGAFSFDRASAMAEQIEAAGQEPLDFSCTIMVLGKTGVGKSATINSIFDEVKFSTDAFQMGTKKVQDVVGTVQGIKVRVIDTPGLLPCWSDQRHNEKILHSVKRFIKKNPPDIVLYLDRLDMQTRDFGDLPLLRTITEIFGPSIWFNAIVVLTHAASAPPDGPNGISSSYEMFVTQRSHVVQTAIRQAAGDMRLMNPVSLVENHSACRTNRAGQRVLPNGQVWKPHLLLLSFASKILAEANTLLKLQDSPPGKPFATRSRVPPLPFLLSSLLQSRPQLKLPEEQFGDEDDMDEDLDESSDSDGESEYDELPPFKRLTKAQLAKLSKSQKKAYFDELEYREKLFMKKQLREEKRRRRLFKKMAASAKDLPSDYNENTEEESGAAGSVPVAMPDFTLPASFDSDNPTHRYRFLDTSNQWLVRPVLETHGWDHDVGYEGINVERLFVVKEKVPLSFSGQVTKDKKESNLQMELASSIKHSESKATSLGLDMHTVGKDMAYTLRSETRFSNFRNNKTAAGLSVTLLGEAVTAGVKLEDKLVLNKRLKVVLTGGAMTGRGDVAYGGSLEATLRDKDYPLGRALSTLGLSVMDWHGDLAIGCNLQSQIPIGRTTNLVARANLNNRGAGQISIRLNSAEQLQIALIGLLPLLKKLSGRYQQMMYGE